MAREILLSPCDFDWNFVQNFHKNIPQFILVRLVKFVLGAVHKGRPQFLGGEGVPNCRRLPTLGGGGHSVAK